MRRIRIRMSTNFCGRTFCFLLLFLLFFFFPEGSCDANVGHSYFSVVCLGGNGGLDQSGMTSYLIKARGPLHDQQNIGMVQLDMGTSLTGLTVAAEKGSFPRFSSFLSLFCLIGGYL